MELFYRWAARLLAIVPAMVVAGSFVVGLPTHAIGDEMAPAAEKEADKDKPAPPAEKPTDKPAGDKPADKPAEPTAAKGQADLDAAVAAKIAADSVQDYSKVITLCEEAISKGLDPEGKKFAQQLLAATRTERAVKVCHAIFDPATPDPRWPQFRRLALTDLELALTYDPDNAEGQLLVARLNALPEGNAKRAVTAVEAAVRLSEKNPRMKAQALVLRGEMASDKELKLADFDEALKLQPDSTTALRSRGFLYLTTDRYPKAKDDLTKAAELDPNHAPTHEALGLILMLSKDLPGSIKHLDKAAELAPENPSVQANRARVLAMLKENDKAIEAIDKALKASPNNVGWQLLKANILSIAGRKDEALAGVDKLISGQPELIEAMRIRAHILAGSEKLPDAIAELEKALQKAPNDVELVADLAMLYSADKKPKRAIELYDKVLSGETTKLPQFYRGRGDAQLSIGNQKEAIDDYEQALKKMPTDSGILNNLAWVLATSPNDKLRNGKRAVELATLACKETEFKAPHILSTLAAAYAETGDFKAAIEWSEKAVQAGAGDTEVNEQLAKELASYKDGKPWREVQNEADAKEKSPPEKEKAADKDKEAPAEKKPETAGQK
ncbi:MAG: tetratricopeptide repeat protein [Planctomycetes bacterium]|nr:tetratricopeptide repeat protein [Planctomycetota bacterium]